MSFPAFWRQTAQLSEDTLARARRVFGDNHPRTLKAADNLATARRLLSAAELAPQGTSDPTAALIANTDR